jgi:hypothetical protein
VFICGKQGSAREEPRVFPSEHDPGSFSLGLAQNMLSNGLVVVVVVVGGGCFTGGSSSFPQEKSWGYILLCFAR